MWRNKSATYRFVCVERNYKITWRKNGILLQNSKEEAIDTVVLT